MLTRTDFDQAIAALGLAGRCVNVHSSFKTFGVPVEGGADGVIDAFLARGCTLMVPAFDSDCELYPPPHLRPARNGTGDYAAYDTRSYPPPKTFTTDSNDLTVAELGILPKTLLLRPERKRGYNPIDSIAALGPRAAELVAGQSAEALWDPFARLCANDGYVLLMGVPLTRATILHYAEQVAKRAPFVRWANNPQGVLMPCRIGSCSSGFDNLDDVLRPIETTLTVGHSLWRCFPAQQMVSLAAEAMQQTPEITRCPEPVCPRCQDAIAGGPVWEG